MTTTLRDQLVEAALPATADVVIIGGGVVGVAAAHELSRRGVKVVVLERDEIGHGCSFGNAGWLTPSQAVPLANPNLLFKSLKWMLDPESPLYVQPRLDPSYLRWLIGFLLSSRRAKFERGTAALVELCRVSVDLWEAFAKVAPSPFGFERHGLLAVYEKAASLDAARGQLELVMKAGVRAEQWTSEQVRDREPAVVGKQIGAIFYPDDAHCEPYPAVRAMAQAAERAGAVMAERADVFAIAAAPGGKRLVQTTRGDIVADRIVLAAGSWSEPLGAMLDLRVPILGAKGYSLILPPATPHPTRSIYLIERKVAVNPHANALRVSGTLELVRNDFSINQRRVNVILRGAKAMLALGDPPVVRELWRGLRPCLPDGMPMIGRARGRGDVWLSVGHQMAGLKTATGSGLLLAQLMTGETPRFDPEPFRADRY